MRPLILLSPAKTLNFESALSPSLARAAATAPQYLSEAHALASSLGTLSKPELAKVRRLVRCACAVHGWYTRTARRTPHVHRMRMYVHRMRTCTHT